jgi:hypothetical protein
LQEKIIDYYVRLNKEIETRLNIPVEFEMPLKKLALKRALINLIDNAFNYGLSVYKGKERMAEPTSGNPANNTNNLYFLAPKIIASYKDENLFTHFGQNDVQDGPDPALQIVTNGKHPIRRFSQPDASNSVPEPTSASSSGSSNIETLHKVQENPKNKIKTGLTTKSLDEMTRDQLKGLLDDRFIEYDKYEKRESLREKMVKYYEYKNKAQKMVRNKKVTPFNLFTNFLVGRPG